MKILVTGASGFIGSFMVSDGLERGHEMWAGMRHSSSKQYLTDPRIRFAELDLSHPTRLREQLQRYKQAMGGTGWDYVIHAAGATKSLKREGFFRTNTEGTKNLVEALRDCDMMPKRFVFVSSLSIFGAIREEKIGTDGSKQLYIPISDKDTPRPNTAYGESKLAAETWLRAQTDVPWVILRPTGVYGPRERDYFLIIEDRKSVV